MQFRFKHWKGKEKRGHKGEEEKEEERGDKGEKEEEKRGDKGYLQKRNTHAETAKWESYPK